MSVEVIQAQPYRQPSSSDTADLASKAWAFGEPVTKPILSFGTILQQTTITSIFQQVVKGLFSAAERQMRQMEQDGEDHAKEIQKRKAIKEQAAKRGSAKKVASQVASTRVTPHAPLKVHQETKLASSEAPHTNVTPDPTEAGIKFVVFFLWLTGTRV